METEHQSLPLLFASPLVEIPGQRTIRQLGKISTSSLLRYFFNGDIVLWRNFQESLYPVARVGLHEIESTPDSLLYKNDHFPECFSKTRFQMAQSLLAYSKKYSWIIFATPGVLALRNWDHLFEDPDTDVLVSPRIDGLPIDSFFAIRGAAYPHFLACWEEVHSHAGLEGTLLASILQSRTFMVKNFEKGEVARPFLESIGIRDLMKAAVVDLSGGTPDEMTKLGFALHMMGTFGDKDGVFLDLLES
jgi:hypothetical protein